MKLVVDKKGSKAGYYRVNARLLVCEKKLVAFQRKDDHITVTSCSCYRTFSEEIIRAFF